MAVTLKGMTWDHTRGYLPMVATAQRFHEMYPEIEIRWDKRSLQAFADYPLEELVQHYDLLVIDHPWVGEVFAKGILLPLDEYLDAEFLAEQQRHTVGLSYHSYHFGHHQWALPIDAAAPVASYRADLLDPSSVPRTWQDVMYLAQRGRVIFPAKAIDSWMNFLMLVVTLGGDLFRDSQQVVDEVSGVLALKYLKGLTSHCPQEILRYNPIDVYEVLSREDHYWYCPFAYGYINYARDGYAPHRLTFDDLVEVDDHGPLKSVLGGTGLAISVRSSRRDWAVRYSQFVAAARCQSTLYWESGGQPGHRTAWLDPKLNKSTSQFALRTLPALDRSYLRPRYWGYLPFQEHAGAVVHEYLRGTHNPHQTIAQLNRLYQSSVKETSW